MTSDSQAEPKQNRDVTRGWSGQLAQIHSEINRSIGRIQLTMRLKATQYIAERLGPILETLDEKWND